MTKPKIKFWNLGIKRGADGSKHLDVQVHGNIDGGWMDDGPSVDTASLISELQQHLDAKTIGVRINSMGGSAFGGVAVYNALQSHPADVTTTVEGIAASAASLIAMAGKTVMGRGTMMMIHSPAAGIIGNAAELRKAADFLDKVQDSLASIYTKKTGKSLDEINNLLDEETWMTADEALAAGFSDAVGEQDESEDAAPRMAAEFVIWQGVKFPAAKLPTQILAMATKPTPPALTIVPPLPTNQTGDAMHKYKVLSEAMEKIAAATGKQIGDLSQSKALTRELLDALPPIEREEISARSSGLIGDIRQEGIKMGVEQERARLKGIDDLGLKGCEDIIAAAKYGDKPTDAPTLAVAAIKAGKQAGTDLLQMRRLESAPLAAVATGTPDQGAAATEEQRAIKFMADRINARRGGSK